MSHLANSFRGNSSGHLTLGCIAGHFNENIWFFRGIFGKLFQYRTRQAESWPRPAKPLV